MVCVDLDICTQECYPELCKVGIPASKMGNFQKASSVVKSGQNHSTNSRDGTPKFFLKKIDRLVLYIAPKVKPIRGTHNKRCI